MTEGFAVRDLDRVAAAVGRGSSGLAGMADRAPGVPDAGASSAAVAGVLCALSAVVGSIVRTADVAGSHVLAGDRSYRAVDGGWADTLDKAGRDE
jgi:galactokinase/mevalonate kinase-like predicted kinase